MKPKHYSKWKASYGANREDFEEFIIDVQGWDPEILDKDEHGNYHDHNTELLYTMWFGGWSNGYDRGHAAGCTKGHIHRNGDPYSGAERRGQLWTS